VLAYALVRRGASVLPAMVPYWKIGLGGGALAVISYTIALWAMTVAPIAVVAALRETSVLFGAAIAVLFLGEPLRAARMVAALTIVAGLVLLRMA
jgi:drug/metabolite transporter (DMT)-like permease